MECEHARDLLLEALTGTTTPDARRALRRHLAECDLCRAEAAALEQTAMLVRSVPEPRLPEGYWAEFMGSLDRRLDVERNRPWLRALRWIRNPVHAWSTAAATSALVVALGLALLVHPAGQVQEPPAVQSTRAQALMTQAMVNALPAMDASVAVWKAALGAAEVPYDLTGGE